MRIGTWTRGTWLLRIATAMAVAAAPALATSATAHSAPESPRKIAFIVPGQQLYGSGPAWESVYTPLRTALEQRGFETHYVDAPGKLLRNDAELIRAAVESQSDEADYVAIVGHSVGGVSGRYYVKELGGTSRVDSIVAIGSPQYGSPGGCTQGPTEGYESCVYSDLFPQLNAGDDTPGDTLYSVVQSSGEWSDGRLDGGQCRSYVDGVVGSGTGVDHLTEIFDPRITAQVADAADGNCPGGFVDEADGSITWRDTISPNAPQIA